VAPRPASGEALRQLLTAAPDQRWTCADAAAALHMSEAGLRRKLADERLGFRELLEDVRLTLGLALLQGTQQPMPAVAQTCGYQSVAKFSARFCARYGLTPAQLRGED